MLKKRNKVEFIDVARKIHGDRYVYDKVEYVNSSTKVNITCPIHGDFSMLPKNHIQCRQGCPKCAKENIGINKNSGKEGFLEKAIRVHGNKYDYSKVEYVNNRTKVCIICPEHGEFWQVPYTHTKGFGCSKCGGKNKMNINDFIEKSIGIHENKYRYDNVVYRNCDTKVEIICPIHGPFMVTPHHHLNGVGCSKCSGNYSYNNEEIIKLFAKVHNDKYDYSNVKYVNTHEKVTIICKRHGAFEQTPKAHLMGQGCPICGSEYNKSETKLYEEIKFNFNDAIRHYRPPFLRTNRNGRQEIDIFIPSLNVGIEYQGKQHFEPVHIFGAENGFERMQKLDEIKYNKCINNNIKLYYFSYEKNIPEHYIDKVYINENELINDLKLLNNDRL